MTGEPDRPLAATVLAAGLGSRLGNRPKAALRIGGRSLLERLSSALRACGITDISIVIGPYREQLQALAAQCGVRVLAVDTTQGSLRVSQRLAIAAHVDRQPHADLSLFVADLPLLAAVHLTPLLDAWQRRTPGIDAMMPWVGRVPGHPVLLSARAVGWIAASPADDGIRSWLAAHPAAVTPFPATDRAYITDVDTQDDIDRLRAIVHPAIVSWPDAGRDDDPGGSAR